MILFRYLVVFLVAMVSGGFSIPAGFLLSLSPLETYLCSVAGAITAVALVLSAGERIRSKLTDRRGGQRSRGESQVRRLVDRHGPWALGLVGPIFPGVTASTVGGLAIGMERATLLKWLSLGTLLLYAVYTVGLWALVEWLTW